MGRDEELTERDETYTVFRKTVQYHDEGEEDLKSPVLQ